MACCVVVASHGADDSSPLVNSAVERQGSPMASPTGTEVELKLRVDDLAALMRIVVACEARPAFTAVQRNRYFDTSKRGLDKSKFVLRLREESSPGNTTVFVTAKGASKKSADGTLSHVPEEEIVISGTERDAVLERPALAFELLADDADATDARRALVLFKRANVVGRSAPGKAKRFFSALRGEKLS